MDNNFEGKIITVSGPSGAGKNTLVNHLVSVRDDLSFAVSATCRPMREGDVEGETYYFLSKEEFEQKIENGEFVEWFENYPGWYYGTLWSEFRRLWNEGKHVISDIDVMGALNIKNEAPERTYAIFIKPPSIDALKERLLARGNETEKSLKTRMERAEMELSKEDEFDITVINDDLEAAKQKLEEVVKSFLSEA